MSDHHWLGNSRPFCNVRSCVYLYHRSTQLDFVVIFHAFCYAPHLQMLRKSSHHFLAHVLKLRAVLLSLRVVKQVFHVKPAHEARPHNNLSQRSRLQIFVESNKDCSELYIYALSFEGMTYLVHSEQILLIQILIADRCSHISSSMAHIFDAKTFIVHTLSMKLHFEREPRHLWTSQMPNALMSHSRSWLWRPWNSWKWMDSMLTIWLQC
jgi:hypothetical protein